MTNPVLDAISARRSIRAYEKEQISDEQLKAIMDAAMTSPSARNTQPWHFTVVQDAALLARINEAFRKEAIAQSPEGMRERLSDPAYSVFHHAPTVVFISCPPLDGMMYAQTDVGIAIQTMALAAHSIGLGSVILGMPRMAFAGPEGDDLRRALSFPDGFDYCLSIGIGIPSATKEAHPQEPDRITYIR